ncbi:tetratricopeptide repeat protein [Maioricimonas sp. JC845]|uniref:tetratricopeptide repeat protein n=1 Tax=Maioricimonas sp. JC845 TaxID=3232138 RepID=UPI00345ACD82
MTDSTPPPESTPESETSLPTGAVPATADSGTDTDTAAPLEMGRVVRRFVVIGGIALLAILVGFASLWAYDRWAQKRQEAYRTACEAAVAAQNWDELLETSTAWREWDPDNDDSLMSIAQALVDLDRLDEAVATLGNVRDDYKGALEALAFRAEIQYSALNRPFDAEATWRRMVKIAPNADLPRQRLIYFYAMTLQRQEMEQQIRESVMLQCEPPEAYAYIILKNVLNFSDGLAKTTRWLLSYPDDKTLQVAQAVYAARQNAEGKIATFGFRTAMPGRLDLVDRRLQQYPSDPELLIVKIDQAIFEGDARQVTELLSRVDPMAENDSRFWRVRGWLMLDRGRYQEATDAFERALELNVFDWQARWLMADALRKLNRTEEADQAAALALTGKELQQRIFEKPSARDLDEQLAADILQYASDLEAILFAEALARRLNLTP